MCVKWGQFAKVEQGVDPWWWLNFYDHVVALRKLTYKLISSISKHNFKEREIIVPRTGIHQGGVLRGLGLEVREGEGNP